jgi:hypothetical protein
MIPIFSTATNDPDFQELIAELDAELAITDGEDHDFTTSSTGRKSLVTWQ